jgi:hypothetical protein
VSKTLGNGRGVLSQICDGVRKSLGQSNGNRKKILPCSGVLCAGSVVCVLNVVARSGVACVVMATTLSSDKICAPVARHWPAVR